MLYRDVHVMSVHCGCRKGAFYGASMSVCLEFATTKEMNTLTLRTDLVGNARGLHSGG